MSATGNTKGPLPDKEINRIYAEMLKERKKRVKAEFGEIVLHLRTSGKPATCRQARVSPDTIAMLKHWGCSVCSTIVNMQPGYYIILPEARDAGNTNHPAT